MCGAARALYSDSRVPAQMRARLSQAAHPRRPVPVPARTPPRVCAHARQRTCTCVSAERATPTRAIQSASLPCVRLAQPSSLRSSAPERGGGEKGRSTTTPASADVREEQPQGGRLERPSSPPRSRPVSPEQARRAIPAVSHLKGGREGRSAVSCNTPQFVAKRHQSDARARMSSPSNLPSQDSAPTCSDPTTVAALSCSELGAPCACGRRPRHLTGDQRPRCGEISCP